MAGPPGLAPRGAPGSSGAEGRSGGPGDGAAGTPASVRPGALGGNAVKTCWHLVHWTGDPCGESRVSSSS